MIVFELFSFSSSQVWLHQNKKNPLQQTQELADVGSERTHNLKVVGSNFHRYKLESASKPCPVLFLSSHAS